MTADTTGSAESVDAGRVPGPASSTSPVLVEALTRLGDEYGPLGVAVVACRMTDPYAVGRRLQTDGVLDFRVVDGKSARIEVTIPDTEIDRTVERVKTAIADATAGDGFAALHRADERNKTIRDVLIALRDGIFPTPARVPISPGRLQTAADLVEAGADPTAVFDRLTNGAQL